MHATTQTEPPTAELQRRARGPNSYHHEQAIKREANLKKLLEERTAKLQAMEKELADLQTANTEATRRLAKEEEMREQTVIQHFEETEPLRSQNRELQTMAHQLLAMWKHTEEEKALLSDSYNRLVVESTLDIERQRDMFMKEMDDRSALLSRNYERKLEEINKGTGKQPPNNLRVHNSRTPARCPGNEGRIGNLPCSVRIG